MRSLSFELALLSRMTSKYRASVLEEIGLSEGEAAPLAGKYPWPDLGRRILQLKAYNDFLEPAIPSPRSDNEMPEESEGSIAHYFHPMLWPHLFWVVRIGSDGMCSEAGFQNQTVIQFDNFDPSTVRRGLWSRTSLQRLALSWDVSDGWDERVAISFDFGRARFEGVFVFGLLNEWSRLADPGVP